MRSNTTSEAVVDVTKPAAWLIRFYIAGAVSFGATCVGILLSGG